MRMEPDAFLALLDNVLGEAPYVDQANDLDGHWVAYHPIAGVFVGFQGGRQMWSRVGKVLFDCVVVFSEAELGIEHLAYALDAHGFGSDDLEMIQVADGTRASLVAVGLPVDEHLFDAVAAVTATHPTTEMAQ